MSAASEQADELIGTDEAIAAIHRCAFETGDGRRVVHCFIGSIGADWDETSAIANVAASAARGWSMTMLGRCLVTVDQVGKYHVFDTVVPE